jgi:hypothetical protein
MSATPGSGSSCGDGAVDSGASAPKRDGSTGTARVRSESRSGASERAKSIMAWPSARRRHAAWG